MQKGPLPDAARSNTVKQFERSSRGKLECKYVLFLVQSSLQIHTWVDYPTTHSLCFVGFTHWKVHKFAESYPEV